MLRQIDIFGTPTSYPNVPLETVLFPPPNLNVDLSWSEIYCRTYYDTQQHWVRGEGSRKGRGMFKNDGEFV